MSTTVQKSNKTNKTPETAAAVPTIMDVRLPTALSLRDEIDHLFETAFPTLSFRPFGRWDVGLDPFKKLEERLHGTWPKVDVTETAKAYAITAELPGMQDKDIDVKVDDGCLTISGEKRTERSEDDADYHLRERGYGQVRRTFRIPDSVDADKIEAHFEDGVLNVTLPKTRTSAPKSVRVTGGPAKKARKAAKAKKPAA